MNDIEGFIGDAVEDIGEWGDHLANGDLFEEIGEDMIGWVDDVRQNVTEWVNEAAEGAADYVENVTGDVVDWIEDIASDIEDIRDGTYCFNDDECTEDDELVVIPIQNDPVDDPVGIAYPTPEHGIY